MPRSLVNRKRLDAGNVIFDLQDQSRASPTVGGRGTPTVCPEGGDCQNAACFSASLNSDYPEDIEGTGTQAGFDALGPLPVSRKGAAMTRTHFAEGQILFREGGPPDCVYRLLSGAVDILRELDGDPILLGTVGAGQFIGEMGVVENRPRSATARAASEVEVEILTPTEFLDQIARSPRAARELIQRLSQRLREADDRIVNDERRSGQAHKPHKDADSHTAVVSVYNAY